MGLNELLQNSGGSAIKGEALAITGDAELRSLNQGNSLHVSNKYEFKKEVLLKGSLLKNVDVLSFIRLLFSPVCHEKQKTDSYFTKNNH